MTGSLAYIVWNPNLELCRILGFPVRYYSLMWVLGLLAAYLLVRKYYKDMKIDSERFDPLFLYGFFSILIGARLGHCIFYDPQYYFSSFEHFIEMLLPVTFSPKFALTGYRGLASHGGTIGIFIGILLYCRKYKVRLLSTLDLVCVATPLTACCIRLGNLMNSEIIGKATGTDWGFVFVQLGEDFPRHPSQLYEAIAYLIIFIIISLIYRKKKNLVGTGFYFGFCITAIFLFRFFVEFTKEVQSDWEEGMTLDMGQLLSIPFVIIGIWLIANSMKLRHREIKHFQPIRSKK
ncbi:MAG: prolipoprotein diacylglyceryl transferase [Bacteroidaceae bacterium]|nr:prolipoprotein diacylglyceryl transferase [Bacteroidaceae bacterium]